MDLLIMTLLVLFQLGEAPLKVRDRLPERRQLPEHS
jgi:hypothetical protein